jgi:hypothetical protein
MLDTKVADTSDISATLANIHSVAINWPPIPGSG